MKLNYLWSKAALSKRWWYCMFPTFKLPGPFRNKLPFNHFGILPRSFPSIGSRISFSQDLSQTETSHFGYNLVFLSSTTLKLWFVSNFFCFNILLISFNFIFKLSKWFTFTMPIFTIISRVLLLSCYKFIHLIQVLAQCCETVFHDGHSTNDRNKIGFLVLWLRNLSEWYARKLNETIQFGNVSTCFDRLNDGFCV